MMENELFKKFLVDTIGLYGTLPDDETYHIDLEIEFRIARCAFEKLKFDSLKEMVVYEFKKEQRKLNEYVDEAINKINNYKVDNP